MMGQERNSFTEALNGLLEGQKAGRVFNVAIAVLLIAALLLPPVSAQERILSAGYEKIDHEEGGSVQDPDGTQITLWPEGMVKDVKVKVESVPRAAFMDGSAGQDMVEAAKALPSHIHVKSPVYQVSTKGTLPSDVSLSVPIPNNAEPYETLSLYNWNGTEWEFLPSRVLFEDDVVEARLDFVPQAIAAAQSLDQPPRVSAELPEYGSLPDLGSQALAELNPLGYYLGSENNVEGSLPNLPDMEGAETYRVLPTLRNWTDDGTVRSDLVDNLLAVSESQAAHIQAISDLVTSEMYGGIDLDYRGINPDLKDEYTAFVQRLAEELHAKDKRLTVHVEAPAQVAEDRWETGAYDWGALGHAADSLKFPAFQDPAVYAPGGQMEALLWWAVGQVERYKLQPVFSGQSVEKSGGLFVESTYRDALAKLSKLVGEQTESLLVPGQQVTVSLDTLGIQHDPSSGQYWFTYHDEASGEERTVWLEDASSLSRKLDLMGRFNLGGVALTSLWDEGSDPRLWSLVQEYQSSVQASVQPVDSNFSVVWSVNSPDGSPLAEQTTGLDQRQYTWTAPQEPGTYEIAASILANDGQTVAGHDTVAYTVAEPTPTPTPTPTPEPTFTPTPEPTPTLVPTPVPTKPAQSAAGGTKPKATAVPASGGGNAGKAPPNPGFGYGVQAHMVHNDQAPVVMSKVKDMGFGWVKQQVEWKYFEGAKGAYEWGALDSVANTAQANGVKVLWSVVNAPGWARGGQDQGVGGPPNNPQDLADFLGAMAAHFCGTSVKAIEVWNEQNLHYEWGNMKIDPAAYMVLLKPSYNKIKAACPGMIVVSGALTPTGAPPPKALDDFKYLEGMYQNGLKNYSDAIGAHPSGFNVAPSVPGGQEACDFITQQASGYRGPCNSKHHSWSFYATLHGYYNIMKKYGDGNKKIWPTEFGWASGWTGAPGYEYANDNSLEEQAAWTAEAYKLMKQWGFVGVPFLWNLNFRVVAPGTEKAQWGIVWEDWTATPTYGRLKAMPK